MKTKIFSTLLAFLEKLEQQDINYTLAHHRAEAIMVLIAVPGERWEIEFMNDGSIEVEKFFSTGEISDAKSLDELFARYADPEKKGESSTETELLSSGKGNRGRCMEIQVIENLAISNCYAPP